MNLIIKESEKDFYWIDEDSNTIFSPIFDDEEKAYHWFGEIMSFCVNYHKELLEEIGK